MYIRKITAVLAAVLALAAALSAGALAAQQITEDQAKAIALEHAGLAQGDVTQLRIELERDDGRLEYEIEFTSGNREYDYEIDAETGRILSFESEVEYRPSGSWFAELRVWLQNLWSTLQGWFVR